LNLFFPLDVDVWGTTAHFTIPEANKSIEIGDSLELFDVSPFVPAQTFSISGLEITNKRVTTTPELVVNFGSVSFDEDHPPPFARVHRLQQQNFSVMHNGIDVWLGYAVNQPNFFPNLDALLNPILSGGNPTVVQIGDAKAAVTTLYNAVNQVLTILEGYYCSTVSAVDTLIGGFTQQGADRAVDILLSGRFGMFFGLTVDQVSYSGHMLEQLREVQREDLPVRKVRRADFGGQTLLASYTEQDFEYDHSDVEDQEFPISPI
jgi:hypothetical protein